MTKLLAVDDDRDFLESLQRYFSALGYTVVTARDGREALKMLLREEPDCILLDLRMPVMDGIAFLKVVRSYVRFRSIPIVVMTGVDEPSTLDELHHANVRHIFRKTQFEFADIRRAVEGEVRQ